MSHKKINFKLNQKENRVTVKINPQLYPLEAIYGASYVFIDRAYLFLDGNPKKEVKVFIKGKEKMTKKELDKLAREFLNEILNYTLREKISKHNQKIREYIVGQALLAAIGQEELEQGKTEEDWQKDPLGIAIPWEEKYGKKSKVKTKKSK